jgi:GntR family transcriptional regulator
VHFRIEASSGVPVYRQIVEEVKASYVRGIVREGDRLASIRELAMTLGINPTTVVKAYDQLEAEGLIERKHGLGFFLSVGRAPSAAPESGDPIERMARRLAVEGRRHGMTEARILDVLRLALRKLRPARKSRTRVGE